MNGLHDLGGMHGFGPVKIEENEPTFHSEWEGIVFALCHAKPAWLYNTDEFRHCIENMNPTDYLAARYYERWLFTAEYYILKKGVITKKEYDARTRLFKRNPRTALPRFYDSKRVMEAVRLIHEGSSTRRDVQRQPKFKVGDRVLARNINPTGHTRLPRYVRGKAGTIMRLHGILVLPDTNAHGKGENPEHVYSVRFDSKEVWGESAEDNESLHVDLWESYLQKH